MDVARAELEAERARERLGKQLEDAREARVARRRGRSGGARRCRGGERSDAKKRVDEAIATVEAEAREALDAAKRTGETEVEHARAELATQTRALRSDPRRDGEKRISPPLKAVKKGKASRRTRRNSRLSFRI